MDGFMGLERTDWVEIARALAVVAGGIAVAWLLGRLVRGVVHRLTHSSESTLDDVLVRALRPPLTALIVLQAAAIGFRTISVWQPHHDRADRVWLALTVLIVTLAVQRAISALLTWYSTSPSQRLGTRLNARSLPLVRRAVNIAVLLIGGIIVLDALGVQISPLLAGLGIGGIAVALALQPLLANVFASSYMLSDASVRVGDLVEIEGGVVGTVEDIGWRATRIRSFDNNVVLMPNSKLADATMTNYSAADAQSDARVLVGVSYESDLEQVERVCLEVMTALRDEHAAAVKTADPVMRFTAFGESNVEILLKMRAVNWGDSFALRHDLIKRLHARFVEEGIVINYPARRLLLHAQDASALVRSAPEA
ncbi:MAG: mechanosensitive ion channel protein [Chloroflexota bacterium]